MLELIHQVPRFFSGPNLLFLGEAFFNTLLLSLVSCLVGSVFGGLIASVRLTRSPWLLVFRALGLIVAEVFRRIPPLVVLFLVFFGFSLAQIDLPPFVEALMALSIIATAFMAEIIRSGFDAIPHEQWDAARTLNFSQIQMLHHVILPQAWKVIVPTASLFFVMFLKDSALASQIGVTELTFVGKNFIDRGFSPALSFGTILILYFIMSYPLACIGHWLERRLASS